MRKRIFLLLIILLATISMLLLSGCEKTPVDGSEDDPPDDGESPVAMLDLIADGVCEYRVVRGDSATATETAPASLMRRALETVTGFDVEIVTDYEDKDDNADIKEILVGRTNRPESRQLMETLGEDEFAVAYIGNKLVLVGKTDELLMHAVTYFLSTYAGYESEEEYTPMRTISIPKQLSEIRSFSLRSNVALYVSNQSAPYLGGLQEELRKTVSQLDVKTLDDDADAVFDASRYGTVIVVGVERMPASSKAAIDRYMNDGGRLLTLGGPAYEEELYQYEGDWYEKNEYLFTIVEDIDEDDKTLMFDTGDASVIGKFIRSTNDTTAGYRLAVGDYDLEGSDAQLFHEVDNVSSWDNILYRFSPVPTIASDGLSAIAFWIKAADDHTESIYLEFTDAHGSRWITQVNISQEWEYKILMPSDFTWWHDSVTPMSDIPSFNRMTQITFGFAFSGQNNITAGHHSYVLSEPTLISAENIELGEMQSLTLDSFSPMYELYPITNAASLVTDPNQVFVMPRDYVISKTLISCNPGRQGIGYGNDRTSRFVPLIEVKDEKGLHSGYAAWMHIFSSTGNLNGKREGAILACFSSVSNEFYNADGIAAVIEVVKALMGKAFIVEGGTDEFTYIASDTDDVKAGVHYLNAEGVTAQITLYKDDEVLISYSSDDMKTQSAAHGITRLLGSYDLSAGRPTRAVVTLTRAGKIIDMVQHDICFWEPTPEAERKYVYIEDGVFKKDGEIVNFFGVNYMPSYGIAEQNGEYFEHYISRGAYDPTVIANDLARIKDIGMNSVSVFIHNPQQTLSNNMLDLVRQCAELGIYVNMSIRSAYPLSGYDQNVAESLIKTLHFDENEWIYAYDTAWEPRLGQYEGGNYIGRKGYDKAWSEWINVQYGSLSNAEAAWGVKLSKTAEGYPYVSDAMLDDTTTKYNKVTAAYYRFLDDHISALMQEKWNELYPLAPNQYFVFRMSMSGSGYRHGAYVPSLGCFDFQSFATSFGYMEPEGYALNGGAENAWQIAVANAYARYVQPDSPVVWKEFGQESWSKSDDGNFNPSAGALNYSKEYYEYVLEYCLNSYTSGMYAWYYAGGYRVNENSDYGIINPDGSDRPVTELLREYAPKFINQGARPAADVYIEVERDNQNGGIYGIYDATIEAVKEAYNDGLFFEFVDANRETADEIVWADEVYTEAVGGTVKTGIYPLRYVNGMVKDFSTYQEGGKTYAKVVICNSKQSTWRTGTVSLVSYKTSDVRVNVIIDEQVDYLEDVTLTFEVMGKGDLDLRFSIEGVEFGNLYHTTVR